MTGCFAGGLGCLAPWLGWLAEHAARAHTAHTARTPRATGPCSLQGGQGPAGLQGAGGCGQRLRAAWLLRLCRPWLYALLLLGTGARAAPAGSGWE